jgi:spermidine/putrescine transport system substrate-binding protein
MSKKFFLMLTGLVLVASCQAGGDPNARTLRIHNWGDYIDEDVVDLFIEHFEEEYDEHINVEYSTYDVNETVYNQIANLGQQFDLIAPSEYMIQRMIEEDMLIKLDRDSITGEYENVPHYNEFASPFLKDVFESITIDSKPGESIADYAVGYMWGTVGIVYDPADIDEDDVQSWQVLYDTKYAKNFTIKNSVREAYLIGIMDVFKDELDQLYQDYLDEILTIDQYNDQLTDYINNYDSDTIIAVEQSLLALKENSRGLEIDSGKNDIVSGKIDMQVAWSGDAVYSMELTEGSRDLEYVIPSEGSNIWFDGWVMPQGADTELAQAFVDFVSQPEIAILNMDYIGYTSFIGGQEVLDRVEEMADDEDDEITLDLSYFFAGSGDIASDAIISVSVENNRFVATQYPDMDRIIRCGVMRNFPPEANELIVAMWSRVRTTTISPLTIGIVVGVGVVGLATAVYFYIASKNSKRGRRRQANKKASS